MPEPDRKILYIEFKGQEIKWDSLQRSIRKLLSLGRDDSDYLLKCVEEQFSQPFDRLAPSAEIYRMRTLLSRIDGLTDGMKRRYLFKRLPMRWREQVLPIYNANKTFVDFADALDSYADEYESTEYEVGDLMTSMNGDDAVPGLPSDAFVNATLDKGSVEATASSDSTKTEVMDVLSKEFEKLALLLTTGNAAPKTTASPAMNRGPYCVFCASEAHNKGQCQELTTALRANQVVLKDRLVCWPDGLEIDPNYRNGGMIALVKQRYEASQATARLIRNQSRLVDQKDDGDEGKVVWAARRGRPSMNTYGIPEVTSTGGRRTQPYARPPTTRAAAASNGDTEEAATAAATDAPEVTMASDATSGLGANSGDSGSNEEHTPGPHGREQMTSNDDSSADTDIGRPIPIITNRPEVRE
ncbi:hypothetical protein EC988_005349, partial [Linderina pennispora]